MRMARRRHRATLTVVAVLLLATAGIALENRSTASLRDGARLDPSQRNPQGTVSPVDLSAAVVAPVLGAVRTVEPRLAPPWVLPGLAAALAALRLLRRLRRSPTLPTRRVLLRGSVANRAPPIQSFA